MKKLPLILLCTNIVTICILVWCCWGRCCKKEQAALTATQDSLHQSQMLLTKCQGVGGGCNDPDGEIFTIQPQQAVQLVGKYTEHWELINAGNTDLNNLTKRKNTKDTRSIWFSLKRLKGFIQYIETKSAVVLPGECSCLGIRMYLGAYTPQLVTEFFPNLLPEEKESLMGKTTVLMIPTYHWNGDGKEHDFNPDFYLPPNNNTFSCIPATGDTQWTVPITALMMNHGGIIPPPFPSSTCLSYMNSGADFMINAIDPTFTTGFGSAPISPATCED